MNGFSFDFLESEVQESYDIIAVYASEENHTIEDIFPSSTKHVYSFVTIDVTDDISLKIPEVGDHLTLTGESGEKYDIVPRLFEGGHRIWESSVDLARFIAQESQNSTLSLQDKTVLELGCGYGIPGIISLKFGSKLTVFSDFNAEVLRDITGPTLLANGHEDKIRLFSGDWLNLSSYLSLMDLQIFDVILSAETLYSLESCSKVLSFLPSFASSRHFSDMKIIDCADDIETSRFSRCCYLGDQEVLFRCGRRNLGAPATRRQGSLHRDDCGQVLHRRRVKHSRHHSSGENDIITYSTKPRDQWLLELRRILWKAC